MPLSVDAAAIHITACFHVIFVTMEGRVTQSLTQSQWRHFTTNITFIMNFVKQFFFDNLILSQISIQQNPSFQYRGADKSLARLDWKNNWKVAIFRPTRRSLLPRRAGCTEKFLICWVACKSQSLVAVACFVPGRAKDL